jgi:hypothetical protein
MKYIIGVLLILSMLATPSFALDPCQYGQFNNTTSGNCEAIVCAEGYTMNLNTELCEENPPVYIGRNHATDCPAPSVETGYKIVTSIPKDLKHKQAKTYLVVSYTKPRWNTNVFLTEDQLTKTMNGLGYQKISYRATNWAFSKWKYVGA